MQTSPVVDAISNIGEVAKYLKVTERAIYWLLEAKRIPAYKLWESWRFSTVDIVDGSKSSPQLPISRKYPYACTSTNKKLFAKLGVVGAMFCRQEQVLDTLSTTASESLITFFAKARPGICNPTLKPL